MRRLLFTVVGVVVATAVAGSALALVATSRDGAGAAASCSERLAADQAEVHTDPRWTETDLPGVGSYPEIHWQLRAAGNPCSRVPGPTEWRYQGVIRLRPEDAAALADRYDWRPVPAAVPSASEDHDQEDALATPDQLWPALAPFVPGGTRWLHSRTWADKHSQGPQWREMYLAPDRALALVMLFDH